MARNLGQGRASRPHIRVEMSFQAPALSPVERPIRSLIVIAQRQPPEIDAFPCVDPVETAADKLSALAWRVRARDRTKPDDDPTIIRHLHDLAALERQFVRSLVGLDRAAAKRAFDAFIEERKLTAHQHEFVNMVIDHLTARGVMDPRLLYESPFTDLDPLGVAGVFQERDVVQLIEILRDVQGRAAA
jgi:EcoEI R protein C-terminal/Nucleotidyl transferase AbiEii toxin, Type IV TA system